MAKVTFERVNASILDQNFGGLHKREWARCDLALPAAELRAIAGVLDSVEWIEQAAEHDGALYIRLQYDLAWLIQERAFHAALAIARRQVAGMLNTLRTTTPRETPEPQMVNRYVMDHRGAYANVARKGNGSHSMSLVNGEWVGLETLAYVMPEGHYGPGFAVHTDADGNHAGYFLVTERYDDKRKPLAAALLASLFPDLGIGTWNRLESYGEVPLAHARHDLRDIGAACYSAAVQLIENCRREVAALQWGGKPSVFTSEDDDARDWLTEQVRAGATIECVRREDAEYEDVDGVCEFTLSDGTPLAHYIVTRLQHAEVVLPEGYPFEHRREAGAPLAPLVFNPKSKEGVIAPRARCVPFQAFQSYCSFRRHDGDRECVNPGRGGCSDTCSAGSCPLTIQVYQEDVERYTRGFGDDPAFDDYDWERDSMARAIHRNTERSFAWRAAGEDAVNVVVNTVLRHHFGMGVERHLFGSENMRAARAAVEQGHLVVDQEMPGFGVVLRASPRLLEQVAQAQDERRRQADADVVVA